MNDEHLKNEADVTEITKPVFYLDWNVISYLHDPSYLEYERRITLLCLKKILAMINRSSMINPYSYAHLSDIRQGSRDHHMTWLNYLQSTSDLWKVVEMQCNREKVAFFKINSVFDDFTEYDSEQCSFEFYKPLSEHFASAAFEPVNAAILRQIEKYERNPNAKILQHATHILSGEKNITGLQIMRFNKTIRNKFRDLNSLRIRYPEAKQMIKENPTKPFRQLVDQSIAKSDFPWRSFEELEQAIPLIGTAGYLSPFMERVNRLSIIANMLGIGLEKLKKATAFTGLVNDLGHLSLGLRCHYFVSEDSALIEKAVFIKNMIGLPVMVISAEGLNRLLLTQIASYYNNQEIGYIADTPREVTFRFTDENGEEIRTYVVNVDKFRVDGKHST